MPDLSEIFCEATKIISEATGKDLKKVEADTDRDYWLDADEALEYGLISKIISNRDELKKIK